MRFSEEDFDLLSKSEQVIGEYLSGESVWRFYVFPIPRNEISDKFKPLPSPFPNEFYIYFGHPIAELPPTRHRRTIQGILKKNI